MMEEVGSAPLYKFVCDCCGEETYPLQKLPREWRSVRVRLGPRAERPALFCGFSGCQKMADDVAAYLSVERLVERVRAAE